MSDILRNENAVWRSLKEQLNRVGWFAWKLADKSTVGIPDAVILDECGSTIWIELKYKRKKNVIDQLSGTQFASLNRLYLNHHRAYVIYYDPASVKKWALVEDIHWTNHCIEKEHRFEYSRELVEKLAEFTHRWTTNLGT